MAVPRSSALKRDDQLDLQICMESLDRKPGKLDRTLEKMDYLRFNNQLKSNDYHRYVKLTKETKI